MKRTTTMTSATNSPAPESAANAGLTCELCCLVANGTVEGVTGRLPPTIEGSVVAVVVGAAIVVLGVKVLTGDCVTRGAVVGGAVRGGAVVVAAEVCGVVA